MHALVAHFNLNNNSLSKVVDTHDPSLVVIVVCALASLLGNFFSLFSLYARTIQR